MHSFTHAVHEEARRHRRPRDGSCARATRTPSSTTRAGLGAPTLPEFVWQIGRPPSSTQRSAISIAGGRCRSPACSTRPRPRSRACRPPASPAGSPAWSSSARAERTLPTAPPPCSCSRVPTGRASSPRSPTSCTATAATSLDAEQHTDRTDGVFFQRVEFALDGFDLARDEIEPALAPLVERFGMQCAVRFSDDVPRVGGARLQGGALPRRPARAVAPRRARRSTIPVVISNHPDHAEVAEWFGVEFVHLPVTPDTKPAAGSARCRQVLERHGVTLVVLARYMQILSAEFVARWPDADHQHPPLVPARVHGRPALPPGARARA